MVLGFPIHYQHRNQLILLKRNLFAFTCILCSHLVIAQVETLFSYSESFGASDGLEDNVIGSLCLDQNDLLWIGVNGTLQLFDGDQFINMGHLVHPTIATGSFGYGTGGDVFMLKENILYKFTPEQYTSKVAPSYQLPSVTLRDLPPKLLYEDAYYLYISHPNDSLYQVDKKSLLPKHIYTLPHKPNRNYRWSSIYINPEPVDAIPFYDSLFQRCTFDLGTGEVTFDKRSTMVFRGAIAAGDTMLALQSNTLEVLTPDTVHYVNLPEPGRGFNGDYFLLKGRDSVYVALQNAIYLFNLRTMTWISKVQRTGGLSLNDVKVREMELDKTGHLYISTFNTGMIKLYPSNKGFQYLGIQGSKKHFIKCIRVSEKNNLVLAGTFQDGLLVFDTNGVLKHHLINIPDTHSLKFISSIIKMSESRYILFSDKTFDLTFKGDQYSIRELADTARYLPAYYDVPIEDDTYKRYFIFNHRQIIELLPDDPTPVRVINQELLGASVSATISNGQYVRSALDELTFFNQALIPNTIRFNVPNFGYSRCLAEYAPGQFLLGTDMGLFILDTLDPGQSYSPVYEHLVYSILPGQKEKEFWFSTNFGLYRLDANLRYKGYTKESGLQENEFNTNSCYKSESGKLYFGGVNGITAFYPADLEDADDKPIPYISAFSVNGEVRERYIAPGQATFFKLPYHENAIQFRLLGKGLRSPKSYNFQYMVKGLHTEWINLGRNMDIQLQLAPGNYTIYFHIADHFEKDADQVRSMQLQIIPPFYKRWWFMTTLVILPFMFLYYIMNLRRKRLAVKLAYIQELDKKLQEERIRISRDLHDNIGAQMATVKRGINFIIDQGSRLTTEQTQHNMKELEKISTQINQELRDTIWVVQNEQIEISGFITRLKNYVYQMVGPESPYRISYTTSGNLDILIGPFSALNLHRICQETLNNVLKHAEATEINISIEVTHSQLIISISDNGKGYDASVVKAGYGLGNIRNRAEQIGAIVYFNRLQLRGSSIEIIYNFPKTSISKTKSDAEN